MDAVVALRVRRGAARWPALRAEGVSARAIQRSVRAGLVLRVGRGGYVLPETDPALVAAVAVGAIVSHLSAARLHGLDLYEQPHIIDLTVARGRQPRWPGTRMHQATLAPEDRGTRVPVTSLLRTLEDCARTLPLIQSVVILDSALRSHSITLKRLKTMARTARGPGSGRIRQAVAHVDELSGSALESSLRPLLDILGVSYETQVYVEGVGWVDFLVEGWLAIETDGFEFHHDRKSYRNDRRRGNRLVQGCATYLRYSWEDVKLNPIGTLRQIAQVVANGPSTGHSLCN